MKVLERRFRGSLICRILGYPISYGIIKMLREQGKMSLDEIVPHVKRSKQAICLQLAKLKLANIIRYERKGKATTYWIKYPREIEKILDACDDPVGRISQRLDQDY